MLDPTLQLSTAASSRLEDELSTQGIDIEHIAEVDGLSEQEANMLAQWLLCRGQKNIAIIDRSGSSAVLWTK